MKPYKDSSNIRVFSKEVDPMDLIWHTDLEDRLVEVVDGVGWKLQFDNELPFELK